MTDQVPDGMTFVGRFPKNSMSYFETSGKAKREGRDTWTGTVGDEVIFAVTPPSDAQLRAMDRSFDPDTSASGGSG